MTLSPSQEQGTKDRIMVIRKTEVDKFLGILTLGNVRLLMEKDKCCNYIDNYLLATVLVYFKRAGLDIEEYTEENFWRCLYLAHDQEEDEEELKWELLAWAMGDTWKKDIKAFLIAKDAIWKKMDYRSVVSRKQCEQIMALSGSGHIGVWSRIRHKSHSGALRRTGQSDYYPRGPESFTPSYSELCTKCGSGDIVSGAEKVDCDLDEAFLVMDSLDTISEEDMEDEEDTLEMISQQESEDSDSGLESSSDEDYRNFKIFG